MLTKKELEELDRLNEKDEQGTLSPEDEARQLELLYKIESSLPHLEGLMDVMRDLDEEGKMYQPEELKREILKRMRKR